MRGGARVAVLIPALDEEASIGQVIDAIPAWVDETLVVDNGSTDRTAAVAREHGARVVREAQRGYGAACLRGLAALRDADVLVFIDADQADRPDEMDLLVDPIVQGEADLVVGSRVRGEREPGALTLQARFGNWIACGLMRLLFDARYTDLGPFRAVRRASLDELQMADRSYGWTVEMQVKASRRGLRAREVPVSYRRRREGRSKVSGTLRGVIGAGVKIIGTIAVLAIRGRSGR